MLRFATTLLAAVVACTSVVTVVDAGWIDPVIFNRQQYVTVPHNYQDAGQKRYCPNGMNKIGDGSACNFVNARAGEQPCALYGNPGLARCFRPKRRFELRSNDHNTIRSHTSRKYESKIKLNRGCPYLVMQNDGNLVMYDCCFKAIWSTCTHKYKGTGPFRAVMQKDGNFVVYNEHKAIWHTKTCKTPIPGPYRLTLQSDHNLVIYGQHDKVVWSSKTHGKGCSHNPTCGVYQCPWGASKVTYKNPNCIRCRNPWGCTASECCVGTCNTYQCPSDTHELIRNPRQVKCYYDGQKCDVDTCCNKVADPTPPKPLSCGNEVAVCPALRIMPSLQTSTGALQQGITCVPAADPSGGAATYVCSVIRDPNRYCHFYPCPKDEVPACPLEFQQCPGTNFQVGRDPYNQCKFHNCNGQPSDPTPPATCPADQHVCPNGDRVARNRFLNCAFDACASSNLQQIGGDVVSAQAATGGGSISNGVSSDADKKSNDVAGFPIMYVAIIGIAFVLLMGLIVCIGCQRSSASEFQNNLQMFGRGSMAGYEMSPAAGGGYHL